MSTRGPVAATAAALLVAPVLGTVAATDARTWVFAAIAGASVAVGVALWFRRDPVIVLAALWAYQIVRTPLAAATASAPGAGTLVNQLTDIALLVVLVVIAFDAVRPGAPRRDLRWFTVAATLAACGLAGNVLQETPVQPTVAGLWLGTKFWLLVGVTAAVPWKREDADRMLRVLVPFGAAAALLGLLDAVTGGAVADLLKSNIRVTPFGSYRSGAAQSLYSHPNEYSLAMSMLVAIWLARVATRDRVQPRDAALLALFIVAAVVSLRLKAVLSIAAVFAIVAVIQAVRGRRHALSVLAAGTVCLALIFNFMGDVIEQQVETYSGTQSTAREQLYVAGARIAREHFPFGVGFGRYGTAPSRDPYSEVYDRFGLSHIWGLSREFDRFLTDTSWPAVMGEAGYAGLATFVVALLALLATGIAVLRRTTGQDAFAPLALIAVLVVVAVDSTGNPNLFSWNAITAVALVAGATLGLRREQLATTASAVGESMFTRPHPPRHRLAT